MCRSKNKKKTKKKRYESSLIIAKNKGPEPIAKFFERTGTSLNFKKFLKNKLKNIFFKNVATSA